MQLNVSSTTHEVYLREIKVDIKENALKCEKEGINNKVKEFLFGFLDYSWIWVSSVGVTQSFRVKSFSPFSPRIFTGPLTRLLKVNLSDRE